MNVEPTAQDSPKTVSGNLDYIEKLWYSMMAKDSTHSDLRKIYCVRHGVKSAMKK